MTTILLIIQLFIVLSLILVILLQKTGTDSLAGLSGSGHNFMSAKATTSVLSKITIYLAIAFMVNSLIIVRVTADSLKTTHSIGEAIEKIEEKTIEPKVPDVKE